MHIQVQFISFKIKSSDILNVFVHNHMLNLALLIAAGQTIDSEDLSVNDPILYTIFQVVWM